MPKPANQIKRDRAAAHLNSVEEIICALSYYINNFPLGQWKLHGPIPRKWRWPLWTARRILRIERLATDRYQARVPFWYKTNLTLFGLENIRWWELNPDLCLEDFTIIEFANNHRRLLPAVQAWLRRDEIPPEAKTFTPQKRAIPQAINTQKENKLTYDSLPNTTKQAIWDRLKEMQ